MKSTCWWGQEVPEAVSENLDEEELIEQEGPVEEQAHGIVVHDLYRIPPVIDETTICSAPMPIV